MHFGETIPTWSLREDDDLSRSRRESESLSLDHYKFNGSYRCAIVRTNLHGKSRRLTNRVNRPSLYRKYYFPNAYPSKEYKSIKTNGDYLLGLLRRDEKAGHKFDYFWFLSSGSQYRRFASFVTARLANDGHPSFRYRIYFRSCIFSCN